MKQLYSLLGIIISTMICVIPTNAQTDTVPRYNYITIRGGDTIRTICTKDGIPDLIYFRHESYHYQTALIVTNEQDSIEAVNIRSNFDFEGLDAGISRVYSVSYIGVLLSQPGEYLDSLKIDGQVVGISRNYVEINRVHTIGGTVSERQGADQVKLCINDLTPDTVVMRNSSTDGNQYVYIVTDEADRILGFTTDSLVSFAEASPGICRIYGASFSGSLMLAPDSLLEDAVISSECYELSSNFVTVERVDIGEIDPVSISTDLGDTITFCVGDGVSDSLDWNAQFSDQLTEQVYIITDDALEVLVIQESNSFDFESAPGGTCFVYAVSFSGSLEIQVGQNISEDLIADHCYQISENHLSIFRNQVYSSTISTSLGDTIQICTSDEISDSVSFTTSTSVGSYQFIIYNDSESVVAIVDSVYDFGSAQENLTIQGVSYFENNPFQVGMTLQQVGEGCYLLSDNAIAIRPASADGGTISSLLGDSILVCAGNEINLPLNHSQSGTDHYAYALTQGDSIIEIIDSAFTTASLEVGQYAIYGIAFVGDNPYTIGTDINMEFDGCFEVSENHLFLEKKSVNAPSISSNLGDQVSFCTGDGIPDSLSVTYMDSVENSVIIITSPELVVIEIASSTELDFESAGEGICWVWGLNYSGDLTVTPGDTLEGQNLSSECFRLSEDYIEVNRIEPDGGIISSNLGDSISICPDESVLVTFDNTSMSAAAYIYMVINQEDQIVLTFRDTLYSDSLFLGISEIIGLSYDGEVPLQSGDSLDVNMLGCASVSQNRIRFNKVIIESPTITSEVGDSTELCVGDGLADLVAFNLTSSMTSQVLVITDDSLNIIDITTDLVVDFDGAGFGTCLVWGLNYTGELLLTAESNLDQVDSISSGCHAWSASAVTIIRSGLRPAVVMSTEGDSLFLCSGESTVDRVSFSQDSGTVDELSVYIMLGSDNEVIDLTQDGVFRSEIEIQGEARVYHAYYRGELMMAIGDTLGVHPISSDCSSLSDNFISIFFSDPSLVDGGTIASPRGDTIEICVADGENDFITYSHTTGSNSLYSYLIAEPNGKILAVTTDTIINFEQVAPGECWIYGISHTVPVSQFQGADLNDIFTEGCFSLSANKIVIYKSTEEQETLHATQDSFSLCVGDGMDDWIDFQIGEESQGKEVYFVTNEESIIQWVSDSSSINFENVPGGVSWVWGATYGGDLLLAEGDTLFGRTISTLCYSLTSNYIVIDKVGLSAFSVTDVLGDTMTTVCVGNGIDDIVNLLSVNADPNANLRYVVLDESGEVIRIQESASFDFDNTGTGTVFIRGLSYGGNLLLSDGDTVDAEDMVATECWIWSTNGYTVNKEGVTAGAIRSGENRESITLCNDNESADIIHFELVNNDTTLNHAYIVTDAVENIIDVFEIDSMDFNDAPAGICLVYGITYSGELMVPIGEFLNMSNLATGCFNVTNNSIEIVKAMADGGTISTLQGQDSVVLCVGDDGPDRVIFTESTFSFAKYSYLITDTNGVLMEMLNIPAKDFSDSDPGVCRVYGLSYTGALNDSLIGNIDSMIFSDDCYDLSDNYITVTKVDDGPECGQQLNAYTRKITASIYPTLVHQDLYVQIESQLFVKEEPVTIKIIDPYGSVLENFTYKLTPNSNFAEKIDVRELNNGTYIVTIQLKNWIKSFKFIK